MHEYNANVASSAMSGQETTSLESPFRDLKTEFMLKPVITKEETVAGSAEPTSSVRWALPSLSLSMLLSSLGTSIANVGLPTFAQLFGASFQQVQWIVLAYLLAITTLIVSV